MPNNAGAFSERVQLLRATAGTGQYGERVQTWELLATVWAKVTFKRGQRALDSGEVWLPNTIAVTIRQRKDVDERVRLVYQGDTYATDSLMRDRQSGTLQLVCTKIDDKTDGWQ